jgi:hypothetical protein
MIIQDLQNNITFKDANEDRYRELLVYLRDVQDLIDQHKRRQGKVVQVTCPDGRMGRLRLYPKYIEPLTTDVKIEWFNADQNRFNGFCHIESVERIINEFKVFEI